LSTAYAAAALQQPQLPLLIFCSTSDYQQLAYLLVATSADHTSPPPAAATYFCLCWWLHVTPVQIFMAVTSSGSAEFLAVSSLVGYDIYKTYINKRASGQQVWQPHPPYIQIQWLIITLQY
jgi:Na+/proline symporter